MTQLNLYHTFILRGLLQNRIRSGLTIIGIALGVAILLAINLANNTALERFRESLDLVSGKANLEIRSVSGQGFDEAHLRDLRWVWQAQGKYTPLIEESAAWPASALNQQDGFPVHILGVDMLADAAFRTAEPDVSQAPEHFLDIFNRRQVWVAQALAEKQRLQRGESFQLLINDRLERVEVAGVISPEGLGRAYSGNLILMDISTAQDLLGMQGRISRIDLIVPEATLTAALDKLQKDLPQSLIAQRPRRRGEQVQKMLSAFQYNLTALSFVALLVGMFLIYNAMSLSIIRRRSEIGTMRALGASRRQIFKLFLMEAATLGFIGTLIGIGLGLGLANASIDAVSSTVQTLYTGQPVSRLIINPVILLTVFLLGISLSILAALPPVLEAVSIAPAEATRRASYELKVARGSGKLALAGVLLLALAWIASLQPSLGNLPLFGYLAALLVVLGAALLMPLLTSFSLRLAEPLLQSLLGVEGKLADVSLQGALGRTAVAVASLMIGIAMMVSLAVMIGSFRETVVTWVHQTLKADLFIESASRTVSKQVGSIRPDVVGQVRAVPGVQAVDAFREIPIEYNDRPANLGAGDLDILMEHGNLLFLGNENPKTVFRRVQARPSAIISESFATHHRVSTGDTITLTTPKGLLKLPVAGVYYDYASELGYIILPKALYREYYQDDSLSSLAVYLRPGESTEAAQARIIRALPDDVQLTIRTNRELREEVLRIFDNTFAITYALHGIAIAVAILGVMNTLFALVIASRREFGILKYLGASQNQIRKMVLIQAGLLGVLGNLAGLGVGFLLSLLLIYVINKQSFGWTIQFSIPAEFLVKSFFLILFTAILSGILPARMATKTLAPEVLRAE